MMRAIRKRLFMLCITAVLLILFHGAGQAMAAATLRVVNSSPNLYDRLLNVNGSITVTFSSNIQNGSGFSNITLRNLYGINVPVTCTIDGQTLSIKPVSNLDYGNYYTLSIPVNAVKDEAGNTLYEAFTLGVVTVGDYTRPEVLSASPANQASGVATNSSISIKFTEKIRAGQEIQNISLIYGNNVRVPVNIGISGDTLTIKPLQELQYNTAYYAFIPNNAVLDLTGNPNNYIYPIFFTTSQSAGELKISLSRPSNDSKYIPIDNPIMIFYNENIISDSGLNSITVRDKSGNVPVNAWINSSVLYIVPKNSLNFAYGATYTVTVPPGAVKGLSGAAAKSQYTFNFTTEEQMQTPKITDANPQNGVTGAAVGSSVVVSFSENIKQGDAIFDIVVKDEKGNTIKTDLSISNNILTIKPRELLEYNTTYTYIIPYGAVKNYWDVPLKQNYEFRFKTDIERFNPYIQKSFPVNGAVNTTVDGGITVIFNEEVVKGDNFDFISLRDVNYNELPIVRELAGKILRISLPNNLNLGYNTKYVLTIPYGAVKDIWGNTFSASSTTSFTTGYERFSPVIKFAKPVNGAVNIPVDGAIEITFNDKMLKGDNVDSIVLEDSQGGSIKCTVDIINDKIIIKPERNMENNTVYTLILPVGGVKDYWNGVSKNDFLLKFRTSPEKTPPVVKSITPVNGIRNIDTGSSITVKFSENIVKGKMFTKITLTNGNMKNVPYTSEITNDTLTIKPVKPLEENTSYTLRIPLDAVTDKSENQLKEDVIVNFTTKVGDANKDALAVNDVKISTDYSSINIVFNKSAAYGSNIRKLLLKDQNGKTVLFSINIKDNTLSIRPRVKLTSGKRYTIIIPAAALRDKQGKGMANQFSYSFISK